MNHKIIENEITAFTEAFFHEIALNVDSNVDFINDNNLLIPKENYTLVTEFLSSTLKKFYSFDSAFKTPLLAKLDLDLQYALELYAKLDYKSVDIKTIFDNKFIYGSKTFSFLLKELNILKQEHTAKAQTLYQRFGEDISALNKIYEERFSQIFNEEKKYFQNALLSIINAKTFYFDRLLWEAANGSPLIQKHIPENITNTKDYLIYVMSIMHPYSDKYKALELALRIYK